MSSGSVTFWLRQVKAGDDRAAQELWQRYFHRLVGLARKRLGQFPRRAADEEDVALSAFDSFCRGAENGRFPYLHDRHALWRLLVVITARKAIDQMHKKAPQGESALATGPGADAALAKIIGPEPTPEFAAQVAEQFQRLLDLLGDNKLRQVALWKMEGYTNDEIAHKFGCAVRTVERRLRVIRSLWANEEKP